MTDFQEKAREIVTGWRIVGRRIVPYEEMQSDIASALSEAFEAGKLCQVNAAAKGEASSLPTVALQSGAGGDADLIQRLNVANELLRKRVIALEEKVDEDGSRRFQKLRVDADDEKMDRATLLAIIDGLKEKYRYADLDGCVTIYVRQAAKETFAGNCAFVDDDLHLLTFCARWALLNGIPDDLCPHIIPKAKAHLQNQIEKPRSGADETAENEAGA